jgi:hypothetical protein
MAILYDEKLKFVLKEAIDALTKETKRQADAEVQQARVQAEIGLALVAIGNLISRQTIAQESIANSLEKLYKKLARPSPPSIPGPFTIRELENDMFVADVVFPDWSLADKDVVTIKVNCTIAGIGNNTEYPRDTPGFTTPEANEGDTAAIVMTYVDDAGNESAPSPTLSILFSDTQPPAPPGVATFTVREL